MADPIQQMIQDMLNQVLQIVNSPGNDYYLPTWLKSNGYDPYGSGKTMTWGVTLTDPKVIATAASICPAMANDPSTNTCTDYQTAIAPPGNQSQYNPILNLGGSPGALLVNGFSNAYMTSMTSQDSDPYEIVAVITFSTLPNLPPNASISGNFSFTQFCCCSNDYKTCATSPQPTVGSGTFVATIQGSTTATLNFRITDLAPGVLNIKAEKIQIAVPKNSSGNYAISISIDITSIPPGPARQTYLDSANQAFNSPEALNNIVGQMNSIMNAPDQLQAMTQILTQLIDNYLREHHQYPFNNASAALY